VKPRANTDPSVTESFAPPSVATADSAQTVAASPAPELPALVGPQVRTSERYHIMGEHGRGGLGRVSRAHDLELGRDVAIKELISRGRVNEVRFLREALITARLEHPGIVPIHEAGRWPDGTPYYAMKLVSGRSLRDLIAECTTSDQRLGLLHHVIAVADAIAYAHRRKIIHRDLKPANVIIGEFGETVVIDWGLAKDLTVAEEPAPAASPLEVSPDDDLTSAGSVLGTPAYMAPEQARGEHVDQRADVFAIGTMLWELCAARRRPPKNPEARHRVLRRAGIDRDLATIIDKALEPDPERRYPDAGALAADLKAFKAGARIAAREYSLWAMLAHWTRRHRVLALSVSAAVVLATAAVIMSVRNIAAERDRADAALVSAQQERDRARLSEASLLVETDPTRARDLLKSLTLRTPQYALLRSRAQPRSAARIVPIAAHVDGLHRAPDSAIIQVRTRDGDLYRLHPDTGALEEADHDLSGPLTMAHRAGQWLYVRKPPRSRTIQISTASNPEAIPVELTSATHLVALDDAVYVLESAGDLHRIGDQPSEIVARSVHRVAGDGNTLMICRTSGDLEVLRGGAVILRRRCGAIKSTGPMAVVNDSYAALTSDGTLAADRGDGLLELPTEIRGEYEIALSREGVIAIADYSGSSKTWLVRSGGKTLESGPAHASRPYSVATDGTLAAWGYTDGTVIALDTTTGTVWRLQGHAGPVYHIAIDAANARIISSSRNELRVWEVKPPRSSLVQAMPCSIFEVVPSPDGARAAVACSNSTWVWSRETGDVRNIHQHNGIAPRVQWVRGMVCSGGISDGLVLCSPPDGGDTRTLESGAVRITWLTATPDHKALIFASSDGKIWRFDDKLEALYSHQGVPNRLDVSRDGRLLAWYSVDGSFDVFDLVNRRLVAHLVGHAGATSSVTWVDDVLWTSGDDGTLKRWRLRDGSLRLSHSTQVSGPIRNTKIASGGWAASVGEGVLVVSLDATSIALRLDVGKNIEALDVSSDLRYVAVAVNGEIIVADMQRNAIATLMIAPPLRQQVSFLDPTSIVFNEAGALKTLRVDLLDYVDYEPAPEPRNSVTF
jgi:eukaryotic-like serine/threonine-protein kinase